MDKLEKKKKKYNLKKQATYNSYSHLIETGDNRKGCSCIQMQILKMALEKNCITIGQGICLSMGKPETYIIRRDGKYINGIFRIYKALERR